MLQPGLFDRLKSPPPPCTCVFLILICPSFFVFHKYFNATDRFVVFWKKQSSVCQEFVKWQDDFFPLICISFSIYCSSKKNSGRTRHNMSRVSQETACHDFVNLMCFSFSIYSSKNENSRRTRHDRTRVCLYIHTYTYVCTARSREDESRNDHRNAKQNPRWSPQVSFQTAHLKRDMNFDHRGFRFVFRWPFRISSSQERVVFKSVCQECRECVSRVYPQVEWRGLTAFARRNNACIFRKII